MVLVEAVFGGIRRRAFRSDTLDREFRREVRFVDHGKRACQVPARTQNATRMHGRHAGATETIR